MSRVTWVHLLQRDDPWISFPMSQCLNFPHKRLHGSAYVHGDTHGILPADIENNKTTTRKDEFRVELRASGGQFWMRRTKIARSATSSPT